MNQKKINFVRRNPAPAFFLMAADPRVISDGTAVRFRVSSRAALNFAAVQDGDRRRLAVPEKAIVPNAFW